MIKRVAKIYFGHPLFGKTIEESRIILRTATTHTNFTLLHKYRLLLSPLRFLHKLQKTQKFGYL